MLCARLKALAEHALSSRGRTPTGRRGSSTSSATQAASSAGALRLLADWGARSAGGGEPLRHAACGTALEARWWCPACEQTVDDPDAEDEVVHV